jgi:hypothetical protein
MLGPLEDGEGVAVGVATGAHAVDWQASHVRTTPWQAKPVGQAGQTGTVSGHRTHPRLS